MPSAAPAQLLDRYPLIRAHSLEEASARVGAVFSPHRLELQPQAHRGQMATASRLAVAHNQIRLRDTSLNVLHYGADVLIDPGERGDFYMVQLPLSGCAQLYSGNQEAQASPEVLSVLQPQARSRMWWSEDCTMLLLQVPRSVVQARAQQWGLGQQPRFALAHTRSQPRVGAWCQAALDMTSNLDRFGSQWLEHPAAAAALEEFLLSAFTILLHEHEGDGAAHSQQRLLAPRNDQRCLERAKDYIHAHLDRALTTADIAAHACVAPRTLEAVFKRQQLPSPLAYARQCRLEAVHHILQQAQRQGQSLHISSVALAHGFVHLGRFASQYRQQFGCTPTQTLRAGS